MAIRGEHIGQFVAGFVVIGAIGVGGLAAVIANRKGVDRPAPAAVATIPASQKWGVPIDAQAIARQEQEARAERAAAAAKEVSALAGAPPQGRLQALRTCGFQDCPDEKRDAMIALGKTEKERADLAAEYWRTKLERAAKGAQDGVALTPLPIAASLVYLRNDGARVLDRLATTTYGAAAKDSSEARGKAITVSGTVIEIEREGSNYHGGIATGDGRVVTFFAPDAPERVQDGSWVTFKGVFVQRFAYDNTGGGQTKSVVLVGLFR